MHISEGIITGAPAAGFTVVSLALVGYGAKKMNDFAKEDPEKKPLLGMAGAFIFFLSLIPLPAFSGTCSHPCGTPLAGILLGPWIGIALSGLSLLLQAAFFAHGGFSTWGANVITLGVGGAFFGWLAFRVARQLKLPLLVAGMIGGLVGDVMTYAIAGLSLSAVLATGPDPQFSFGGYLGAIYVAYMPTQCPIAIGEMFVTGLLLVYVFKQRPDILESLKVVVPRVATLLLIVGLLLLPTASAFAEEAAAVTKQKAPTAEEEEGGMAGMDEAVNEAMAEAAGKPPRDPYINLEALGDAWNAVMMLAGGIAGFIIGRGWSKIFDKKQPA